MRPLRAVAAAMVALTCRRDPRTIAPDPVVVKVDATPPPPSPEPLVLFHGKVIDLRARAVRHTLSKAPSREASAGDDGYLVDGKTGELRAFSLASGKVRWSAPPASSSGGPCSMLAATEHAAFCAKAATVTRYARLDGATRSVTLGADLQQLLVVGGRVLAVRTDRVVEALDGATADTLGTVTLPFTTYGHPDGLVLNGGGTACALSPGGASFEAACLDASPKLLWHKTYALRKPTDPPGTTFLGRQLEGRFAVVSTWWSGPVRRGVVVRLGDGLEVARVEEQVVAALGNDAGDLEGMLVTGPSTRWLSPSGTVAWTSPEKLEESASVVRVADLLVVASYHPIATGAELRAFDVKTGAVRYRCDIELLPIGHSKYWNRTSVSLLSGVIALRGHEAAQNYLELFDPANGARLFSELAGR